MCDPSIPCYEGYTTLCNFTGHYFNEPDEFYWKTTCNHCRRTFCLKHINDDSGYDSSAVICDHCSKTVCPKHQRRCRIDHQHDFGCLYDSVYYTGNDFSQCIHCLNQETSL